MAFAVGHDSEESAKGGHLGEWKREMVVEVKRERKGNPFWFLYQHVSLTRRIYEEKTASEPRSRSHTGREFVQMPPQSSVGIYTPSSSSSLSPLTLQNAPQTSRRKPKDDDAAYIGASGSKRPRDSVDKTVVPDGRRAKRKKVQSVYDPSVSPLTRRSHEQRIGPNSWRHSLLLSYV